MPDDRVLWIGILPLCSGLGACGFSVYSSAGKETYVHRHTPRGCNRITLALFSRLHSLGIFMHISYKATIIPIPCLPHGVLVSVKKLSHHQLVGLALLVRALLAS